MVDPPIAIGVATNASHIFTANDRGGFGVYQDCIDSEIFINGFESGNTLGWSGTVGGS
jgi:hypothetical protein